MAYPSDSYLFLRDSKYQLCYNLLLIVEGEDYRNDNGDFLVTIPAKSNVSLEQDRILLNIVDDDMVEPDEYYFLVIEDSLPAGVSLGKMNKLFINILDDDGKSSYF